LDIVTIKQGDFAINNQELGMERPKQDSMEIDDFQIYPRYFFLSGKINRRPLFRCDGRMGIP
jgi:hypothetical protein